jgi:hypothetical protein
MKDSYYTPKLEDLRYGMKIEYNEGHSYWTEDGILMMSFEHDNWREVIYDKDFVDRDHVEHMMSSDLIKNERIIRIKNEKFTT